MRGAAGDCHVTPARPGSLDQHVDMGLPPDRARAIAGAFRCPRAGSRGAPRHSRGPQRARSRGLGLGLRRRRAPLPPRAADELKPFVEYAVAEVERRGESVTVDLREAVKVLFAWPCAPTAMRDLPLDATRTLVILCRCLLDPHYGLWGCMRSVFSVEELAATLRALGSSHGERAERAAALLMCLLSTVQNHIQAHDFLSLRDVLYLTPTTLGRTLLAPEPFEGIMPLSLTHALAFHMFAVAGNAMTTWLTALRDVISAVDVPEISRVEVLQSAAQVTSLLMRRLQVVDWDTRIGVAMNHEDAAVAALALSTLFDHYHPLDELPNFDCLLPESCRGFYDALLSDNDPNGEVSEEEDNETGFEFE